MNLNIIIDSIGVFVEKIVEPIGNMLEPKDIITTFIGSFIAAKLAMKQFKEQEDLKIKEKLRLNFYDEYSSLYKELSVNLNELSTSLYTVELTAREEWYKGPGFSQQYRIYDLMVEKIDGEYRMIYAKESLEDIENFIKILKDVFRDVKKINTFMLDNQEIIKFNENIDYVRITYILGMLDRYVADKILELHEDIRKENDDKKNELESLKSLKSIQKRYQEYLTMLLYIDIYMDPIETQQKYFRKQLDINEALEEIYNVNEIIKKEFIGKYFE